MIDGVGILKNNANIFDAVMHGTNNASVITGSQYLNNHALQSSTPGVKIFETNIIPARAFGGTYSIGFFYDSPTATVQGTPLLRFELYEDGNLIPEDTTTILYGTQYQYDLNYVENVHSYGLFQNFALDANKTHQLIVNTSPELDDTVILDYIIFEKVSNNTVVDGKPIIPRIGLRDAGDTRDISSYGTQLVMEQITGAISGSISPGNYYNYGYTYNTPFKTVIGVYPTIIDGNGQLLTNWSDWMPQYSQVKIYIKNVSGSNWSKAVSDTNAWNYFNVRILVLGYI